MEYKFRGKSLYTGEWVYGSLLQIGDKTYILPTDTAEITDYINVGFYIEEVSKESVGQFTGLKDKNGVEIYEGDIIKMHHSRNPWTAKVYFEKAEYKFSKTIGMYGNGLSGWTIPIEIIGNIIDNPELGV